MVVHAYLCRAMGWVCYDPVNAARLDRYLGEMQEWNADVVDRCGELPRKDGGL